MGPGGGLVVEGSGLEATVQDPDEAVPELAQGGVVAGAAGADVVVVGPGTGLAGQGAERPLVHGITEAFVAGVAGQHNRPAAGGTGDR